MSQTCRSDRGRAGHLRPEALSCLRTPAQSDSRLSRYLLLQSSASLHLASEHAASEHAGAVREARRHANGGPVVAVARRAENAALGSAPARRPASLDGPAGCWVALRTREEHPSSSDPKRGAVVSLAACATSLRSRPASTQLGFSAGGHLVASSAALEGEVRTDPAEHMGPQPLTHGVAASDTWGRSL